MNTVIKTAMRFFCLFSAHKTELQILFFEERARVYETYCFLCKISRLTNRSTHEGERQGEG